MFSFRKVIILLLVAAIVLMIFTIFLFDKNKSKIDSQPARTTEVKQSQQNGYYSMDESGSSLVIISRLNKVEKRDGNINVNLSFDSNLGSKNFSVTVFDKKMSPTSYLTLSNNEEIWDDGKTTVFNSENVTTENLTKINGKLIQLMFDLNYDKNLSYLACNKKLVSFFEGKNKLDCLPFSNVMAAYAK